MCYLLRRIAESGPSDAILIEHHLLQYIGLYKCQVACSCCHGIHLGTTPPWRCCVAWLVSTAVPQDMRVPVSAIILRAKTWEASFLLE